MKLWPAAIALLASALTPGVVRALPAPSERDLGAEVRGIFAAKCAGCHGPDLPKPQGRFGYVLDLNRIAGNPEMVIPGRPEESELWSLVGNGEMPPPDSPRGPLSAAEREAVRDWIAAGAPARTRSAAVVNTPLNPAQPQSERTQTERTVRLLGKFHLLLLHFPIALLFAAGIGEFWAMWQRKERVPTPAVQFCLLLAGVAVVPTVILGWLHAEGHGVGQRQLLSLHRWMGTAAGAWVVATAVCAWHDSRRGVRSWFVRAALVVGVVLVVATAHAGGLLAHGRDFFDW